MAKYSGENMKKNTVTVQIYKEKVVFGKCESIDKYSANKIYNFKAKVKFATLKANVHIVGVVWIIMEEKRVSPYFGFHNMNNGFLAVPRWFLGRASRTTTEKRHNNGYVWLTALRVKIQKFNSREKTKPIPQLHALKQEIGLH